MSRTAPSLQSNVSAPEAGRWFPTQGYLHSVEATLDTGATSATVDIYVSNSSHGIGWKLATLSLSAAASTDGFSLPNEENGWAFVRSQVVSVSGGNVKSVTACVGE